MILGFVGAMDEFYPRLLSCRGGPTRRYAARAKAHLRFALETSVFSVDAMLITLRPKVQGGLSLDLKLEEKLLRGRWIVDKGSIVLFAIRSWLGWMMMK